MKDSFDYKKAKEEAERMLEVIERDPQANSTWIGSIQRLTPIIYTLAISQIIIDIQLNTLKEANLDPKPEHSNIKGDTMPHKAI